MTNRASARLRFALRIAGLPAVALCGAAAAMSIPPARAGLRAYQAVAVLTGSNVARRVVSLPIRPR